MIERFEQLTLGVSRIYKNIQKIKKQSMESFGLKSTHVMCLHYLSLYPDGLSATELCRKCEENKAGISRILTDLEHRSLIQYLPSSGGKKYRSRAVLTEEGQAQSLLINQRILQAVEAASQGISDSQRAVFYRVLLQIGENLEEFCNGE